MGLFLSSDSMKNINGDVTFTISISEVPKHIDIASLYEDILDKSESRDEANEKLVDYITRNDENISFKLKGSIVKPKTVRDIKNLLYYCTYKNLEANDINKNIIVFNVIDSYKGHDPFILIDMFDDIVDIIIRSSRSDFNIEIEKQKIIGNKVFMTFAPIMYN